MFRSRYLSIRALVAVLVLGACENPSSPEPLTMRQVAGTYGASQGFGAITFKANFGGETMDLLAEGATVQITLSADGKTTGYLFVPGADEDGSDFDADLAGTWTLKGDTVRFAHDADTFIRDMPFLVNGDQLEGDEDFGDGRIQLVFRKR